MTNDRVEVRIALPGDPDLDVDLTGLTMTSLVIVEGREVLLRLVTAYLCHGHDHGRRWHERAADIYFAYPTLPLPAFAALTDRLQGWLNRSTTLRLCTAPGRHTTLSENRHSYVVIPRRRPTTKGPA